MAQAKVIQSTFSAGELDPNMSSRIDSETYYEGAETLRNWQMLEQGGLMRRPGTTYLATLGADTRLIPFTYSTGDEYLFAFQNTVLKVYNKTGTLLTTLTSCPWTTAMLRELNFAQYADTMFVVHQDILMQRITRTGSSTFTRTDFEFKDKASTPTKQPYYKYAGVAVTLTPSGTTGTITVTTSESYWDSSYNNAGIIIRYKGKEIQLTTYSSATVMNATVRETLPSSSADADWDEQAFSAIQGYPAAVTFHDGRLWFGGNVGNPAGLYASQISDFTNFDVASGEASDAINITVAGSMLHEIRHLYSARHLTIFTDTGEFYIRDSTTEGITPGNVTIRRQTPFGISRVPPVNYDGAVSFIQRNSNTVREFIYSDLTTSYESNSISLLAHHLIGTPSETAVSLGNADRPETYFYIVNTDGDIAIFHSLRSEKKQGWSLWTTTGNFKSICTIFDTTFVVVERTVNSATVYYLEKFEATDATSLDSSKTVTLGSAGKTYTGFTHLAGETVSVVSGNQYLGTYAVATGGSAGNIVITDNNISSITAGINYTPTLKTMPVESAQTGGQFNGDPKRINRVMVNIREALAISVEGEYLRIRKVTDDLSENREKQTGIKEFHLLGYSKTPQVTITQDDPLPLKLLGVGMEVVF